MLSPTLKTAADANLNPNADPLALAIAIVNTVREPLIVLDQELRVVAASRSFYKTFQVTREVTEGVPFFELGDGDWDTPQLRKLLGKIIPDHGTIEDFVIEHAFRSLGVRTMSLNARQVVYDNGDAPTILLGIEDVTERRALEAEKDSLLAEKDILLSELRHRVSNSLQIIASIIMLKAKRVGSEDTRAHLEDAHNRVMSVATVQKQLHVAGGLGRIDVAPYLAKLCLALADSMIADDRPITIKVQGDAGSATCREAESIGLIVTELVINSLKHAFNGERNGGLIAVSYDVSGTDWTLSVVDDGNGKPDGLASPKGGLGTGIVNALARQLGGQIVTVSGPQGTTVTITNANAAAAKDRAA